MALRFVVFLLALCVLAAPMSAFAQNTGGVFGPMVNAGHRSAQYRVAYDPETDLFKQRLHYQQALNGDFMLRGIVQTRGTESEDVEFDSVTGELFWQLSEDGARWRQGVRLDGTIQSDDRPAAVKLHWMHETLFAEQWRARAIFLTAVDVGKNARPGVFLQSRGQIARSFDGADQVGLEIYSVYGSTDDLRPLRRQSHQLGPYAAIGLPEGFSVMSRALFGLTEGTPDVNFGLWVTKAF